MLGIENPQGNTSVLGRIGSGLRSVVESLDPRVIAREGGRSVQHVVGDVGELAKSVVTGKDTLSQSPSARAYQAAGGGVGGVAAAALPYVNVGTAVLPTTRVLTPAGRAAMAADASERAGQALLSRGIATATPGARRAGADAAERLAQTMAARDLGATAMTERPTIYMKPSIYEPRAASTVAGQGEGIMPGLSANADGSLSLIDESGVSRLTPIQPTTPPPPRQIPKTTADLELELMQLQTSTPDQIDRKLQRAFQTGRRNTAARNPTQRNVDWTTTAPTNEADLTKVFNTEVDLMFTDQITADKWRAQRAFVNEIVPFIQRRGLEKQFMGDLYGPGRTDANALQTLASVDDIRSMMSRVPQLQQLYVDTMRTYGF
jgi:hypothetical protein